MEQKKQTISEQIVKFVIVGVINTGIDVALLNGLSYVTGSWRGYGVFGLNSIAYGVALMNSYFMNKYWTFLDRSDKSKILKFSEFVAVNLMGLLLNGAIVTAVTTYIPRQFGLAEAGWLNFAKLLVATPFVMVFNFICYKYWVFSPGKNRLRTLLNMVKTKHNNL